MCIRDSHHSLLLCWKIRTGIKKNVDLFRIKTYLDWFYKYHILPHFEVEEKFIFPILGGENDLIKKAISEHHNLSRLFEEPNVSSENIILIEKELEKHIRFEERILFNEIQKVATEKQLESIQANHSDEKFSDNLIDVFWE